MKKRIQSILFLTILLASATMVNAQCPDCMIDFTCPDSLPDGGICKPVLNDGTVGEFYEDEVTFYMPPFVTDPTAGQVNLLQITISDIIGLPTGIEWECSASDNGCLYFPPADPPTSTLGCVKFCGTPVSAPGIYNVTVAILAQVYIPSFDLTLSYPGQTYETTITLLPAPSGTGTFEFVSIPGCGDFQVDYTATVDPAPYPVDYFWDFGNGNLSVQADPPMQDYEAPGTYTASLETRIYKFLLEQFVISSLNDNWCGDVEEVDWFGLGCTQLPDPYWKLIDASGNTIYTAPRKNETFTGTWGGLAIPLDAGLYTVQVWDYDLTSQDDDLGSFIINISSEGTLNYSGAGGTSGNLTIGRVLDETLFDEIPVAAYKSIVPINQNVLINEASAKLNWSPIPDALRYQIKGRRLGTVPFGSAVSFSNNKTVGNLEPGLSYEWKVRTQCISGEVSEFTPMDTFTMPSGKLAGDAGLMETADLLFFPNPASDLVFVDAGDMLIDENTSILIYDLSGRLMLENRIQEGSAFDRFSVDVSALNSGMYIVNLQNSSEKRNAKLLIERTGR